jgi:hypothetical protein
MMHKSTPINNKTLVLAGRLEHYWPSLLADISVSYLKFAVAIFLARSVSHQIKTKRSTTGSSISAQQDSVRINIR